MNARRGALAGIAAAALVLALGCSALISADLGRVNCVAEGAVGPPACPLGKTCRAGICTFCAPYETCGNGFDDDCNGAADDGCDDGGLGGTGAAAGAGGVGGEGGGGGSAGTPPGGGGSGGTAGSSPGGGGGTGGGTGGTGGVGGGELGAPCQGDGDCANGAFCSPPQQHGAAGAAKICVIGCCTSTDCGADEVCYPAEGGYGICLPVTATGRPGVGSKLNGTACGGDAECRSGLCDGGICIDACCSNGDCPGNAAACALHTEKFTGRTAFLCSTKTGTGFQSSCNVPSDCQSKDCLLGLCTQSCCALSDCSGVTAYSCGYEKTSGGATVRVCEPVTVGSKANGESCVSPTDCQSGWCIDTGAGGFCSDTCCQDGDCGDPTKFGCRALTVIDPPGWPALLFCVVR